MNRYLSLKSLSFDEIEDLVRLAQHLVREPINDSLKNKVVGLLFMNPSLRTLASFQAGASQLGGSSVVIQPGAGSWNLETRDGVVMDGSAQEHIREAIPVLAQYCDLLGIRCFAEGKDLDTDLDDALMPKMAKLCPKPFINMESAADHPCQALADWKLLNDLKVPKEGGKFVLSWAWHPRPLPYAVPLCVASMALLRGMELTVVYPEGFGLPDRSISELRQIGGDRLKVTHHREEATEGAHIVYAKSWAAPEFYGRPSEEAEARASLRDWCLKESWFANAQRDAKAMHCLPVRRNVEISDEILDGPRSVVVQEAANRLHVQKAVMMKLMENPNA
ncbi:MAG: N-acetylornithine carbamoyltransferase [Fimbriimonadaceae bacterium]|nr:N-acetylornithine carbamoyltransferase [Fimbriimonadaceae bacterium]